MISDWLHRSVIITSLLLSFTGRQRWCHRAAGRSLWTDTSSEWWAFLTAVVFRARSVSWPHSDSEEVTKWLFHKRFFFRHQTFLPRPEFLKNYFFFSARLMVHSQTRGNYNTFKRINMSSGVDQGPAFKRTDSGAVLHQELLQHKCSTWNYLYACSHGCLKLCIYVCMKCMSVYV